MRKPNLIIAGAVKAGTTSLFEYLGRHPEVGVSRVKETCFFLPVRYGEAMPAPEKYLSYFSDCSNEQYVMESTPGYLDGGKALAECLRDQVDTDGRIIISLRNPSDRLVSFFRYKKSIVEIPKALTFDEYLSQCQSMPLSERRKRCNDAFWGIDGGRYISFLPGWFEVFGADRVKVVFFDDLKAHPRDVCVEIADWLDIDSAPFLNTDFGVENKTVPYKFAAAHKIAIALNKWLEPILRRQPGLKKTARSMYYLFNSGRDEAGVTGEQIKHLDALYRDDNERLAAFLRQQGCAVLPEWLEGK